LPTDSSGIIAGVGDLVNGGLPTDAVAGTVPTGALGGLANAVPITAIDGLLSGVPAVGELLGGVTNLTGNLVYITNAVLAVPAATSLLGSVTNSRVPKGIQSDTIVDKAFDWASYNNDAV
jgi:hypothetical protein